MGNVYVVGSWDGHTFLCNCVFNDEAKAIAYCDSRANDKYDWSVMLAPLEAAWLHWQSVHSTKKRKAE